MQKQVSRPFRLAPLRWGLVAIGATLSLYAIQSLALWLPYSWAYGLAANATVWPMAQFVIVVATGLAGLLLWILRSRQTAIVYMALALLCLVPTTQMMSGLSAYANQHGVTPSYNRQFQLVRKNSPPDEASVVYGHAGTSTLHLSSYLTTQTTSLPAVVYVHGGGWSGGSRTENGEFYRWLNARGYQVFSIDYRVANAGYASWRDAPEDVVCALAWLNQHADQYHVDVTRVSVMGDSAGGQLALRAAYGIANGDMSSSCSGQPARPQSVVGIVPAVDARQLYDDPTLGQASRANIVRYLGGTPSTAARAYDDATIINHVAPGLPRTLIINAANDTLVSPSSGTALAAKLKANNVETEQYTLPYAVHSYWIDPGGYQNQTSQFLINRFLNE